VIRRARREAAATGREPGGTSQFVTTAGSSRQVPGPSPGLLCRPGAANPL